MAIAFVRWAHYAQWRSLSKKERADETSCGSAAAPIPDERLPLLSAERNRKMGLGSRYVRGGTLRFYECWKPQTGPPFPEGPPGLDLRRLPSR